MGQPVKTKPPIQIGKFTLKPKRLFIIDGIGALLSAFLLGVVLVRFENIFGIPPSTLYLLATIPILFAIYDLYSYRIGGMKTDWFLMGIAIMNLFYCCLSIGFAFYHKLTITGLGWAYILIEVMIVTTLAIFEIRIASKLKFGRN